MNVEDLSLTVGVDGFSLPGERVLTGRGFITGKSGSGKSNTASVVLEELLDAGASMLIIDPDGEYYGLKEDYDLLHVGAGDQCDYQVMPRHAGTIADIALEEGVPVILDVSEYLDQDESTTLIQRTIRELFIAEKDRRKPFLLVVEELHEFLPEGRGSNDTSEELVRVAKRGRKRGLGIMGLSQRPASVSKDFITQCNWLVWHRLTWENDTDLVSRLMGSDAGDVVTQLDDGEGLVMADWLDDRRNVQFRRKDTYDAGSTPGLEEHTRPSFGSPDKRLLKLLAAADSYVDPDPPSESTTASTSSPPATADTERQSIDDTEAEETEAETASSEPPTVDKPAQTGRRIRPYLESDHSDEPLWESAQLVSLILLRAWHSTRRGIARVASWARGLVPIQSDRP